MDANAPETYGLSDDIVITASRLPQERADSAPSVTVIDAERIERLGDPLLGAFVRLTPSAALSTSGPAGSLAEVRLRGAEANHTLLFVDGIRANDPAAGNIPRFELLSADIASRIEVVRGPQSALWGSEAIGGVVAVNGASAQDQGASAFAEGGSFGAIRAAASATIGSDDLGLAVGVAGQRADGIDSFDGNGDRDGYANLALRALAGWQATPSLRFTANGFRLSGESQYDGLDPITFLRADTKDETRNRLGAARLALDWNGPTSPWSGSLAASGLWSSNRNLLGGDELNRTRGSRRTLDGQLAHRFATGSVAHALIVAGAVERERFKADDVALGGFTNQSRTRSHWALTGEWRTQWSDRLSTDVAVRRDGFNRFRDATTLRASALVRVAGPLSLAASYGEGIAQPTFFDLYGFFPGSFVGNPSLTPERSRGWELSARLRGEQWNAALTWYSQRLTDEIVDTFNPSTFLSSVENRSGNSRRQGLELEGQWQVSDALRLSANYAWLDADQPEADGPLREVRRPRHSGSASLDGRSGRFTYGASLAYVGKRIDMDFDLFPAQRVTLGAYWLAGARLAYDVTGHVQLFGRVANAFDDDYQDVVGYRTEGRSVHAGLRLAVGR